MTPRWALPTGCPAAREWDFVPLRGDRGTQTFPAHTRCPCRPAPAEGKSSNAGTEHNVALGCLCTFCWRVTPVNQTISHVRKALLTRPSVIGAACQPEPVPGSARAQGAGSPGGQRRIQPRAPAATRGGEGLGPPLCCKPEAHRWVLLLAKSHARASGSLPGWLATGVGVMAPQNRAESSLRAEACCVSPPARADVGGRLPSTFPAPRRSQKQTPGACRRLEGARRLRGSRSGGQTTPGCQQ